MCKCTSVKVHICVCEQMGTLLKTRAMGDLGEKVMFGERPEEDEKAINVDTQGKNIPGHRMASMKLPWR